MRDKDETLKYRNIQNHYSTNNFAHTKFRLNIYMCGVDVQIRESAAMGCK